MFSVRLASWAGLVGLGLAGCASGDKPDPQFQLKKTEQQRDALRQQLADEQAKSAALLRQVEAQEAELRLTRAEASRLNDQVGKLTRHNQDLRGVLDQLKKRELKRPEVPASPLPPTIDQQLQGLVSRYGDRVWYDRGRGAVSFANDRLFEPGSDDLRSDARAVLQELAGVLASAELTEFDVIIVGHTDATPITKPETLSRHPSNWHLSVHRAIAVKDVLDKAGLPTDRLAVMGYGDQRPVGSDPAQNRRVEVFVVPKGGVQAFEPVKARHQQAHR